MATEEEYVRRGRDAQQMLGSPLWIEAWQAYREKLLAVIEQADSSATDQVMQAKRLLTAGTAAKSYLEKLIVDGKMSAATIEMNKPRGKQPKGAV